MLVDWGKRKSCASKRRGTDMLGTVKEKGGKFLPVQLVELQS